MFKKLFQRIAIIWCLYGIVKLCIFLNPWMFRLAAMVKPVLQDNSKWLSKEDIPWDSGWSGNNWSYSTLRYNYIWCDWSEFNFIRVHFRKTQEIKRKK